MDRDEIWCFDVTTGQELLLNTTTGEIVGRKDTEGNITYERSN